MMNELKLMVLEYRDLLHGMANEMGVSGFAGVLAFIIVLVLELYLLHKHPLISKNQKRVRAARELGNVVNGYLIRRWNDGKSLHDTTNGTYHATYRYKVNDNTYKYDYLGKSYPPKVLELYYLNDPARAFCEGRATSGWVVLIHLIPLFVGVVVIQLLR